MAVGGCGPSQTTPHTTPGTPTTTSPEKAPGGAGDERSARVPVRFTVHRGRLTPPEVSVPAFLAVEITVVSLSPAAETVTVHADGAHTLRVAPGAKAMVLLGGLRPGRYRVTVAGGGEAALAVGGEPGP